MSNAVFKVTGRFGYATPQNGTVTIERDSNIITVRPAHSREVYTSKLDELAEMIVSRHLMKSAADKRSGNI